MQRKTLSLADVNIVVLDEADEMLDMGFIEDMETILKAMPRGKADPFVLSHYASADNEYRQALYEKPREDTGQCKRCCCPEDKADIL